jgi:Fe2+ or Zn2+ uptake regulation protein
MACADRGDSAPRTARERMTAVRILEFLGTLHRDSGATEIYSNVSGKVRPIIAAGEVHASLDALARDGLIERDVDGRGGIVYRLPADRNPPSVPPFATGAGGGA